MVCDTVIRIGIRKKTPVQPSNDDYNKNNNKQNNSRLTQFDVSTSVILIKYDNNTMWSSEAGFAKNKRINAAIFISIQKFYRLTDHKNALTKSNKIYFSHSLTHPSTTKTVHSQPDATTVFSPSLFPQKKAKGTRQIY